MSQQTARTSGWNKRRVLSLAAGFAGAITVFAVLTWGEFRKGFECDVFHLRISGRGPCLGCGWPFLHFIENVAGWTTHLPRGWYEYTAQPVVDRSSWNFLSLRLNLAVCWILGAGTGIAIQRLTTKAQWPPQFRLATIFQWTFIVAMLLALWSARDYLYRYVYNLGLKPGDSLEVVLWLRAVVAIATALTLYVATGWLLAAGRLLFRLSTRRSHGISTADG